MSVGAAGRLVNSRRRPQPNLTISTRSGAELHLEGARNRRGGGTPGRLFGRLVLLRIAVATVSHGERAAGGDRHLYIVRGGVVEIRDHLIRGVDVPAPLLGGLVQLRG